MSSARIDQWLWSVRIFKSRTRANDACKKGKVWINGVKAKPSASVEVDDHIKVGKNRFNYEYLVKKSDQKAGRGTHRARMLQGCDPGRRVEKI